MTPRDPIMFDSIYFPSGNPSLKLVRELLQLVPTAVTITDAEDGTALAFSPEAERLLGASFDQCLDAVAQHVDHNEWREAVKIAGTAPGKVFKLAGTIRNTRGEPCQVVGSFTLRQMAGRQVMVTVMEPGLPLPKAV